MLGNSLIMRDNSLIIPGSISKRAEKTYHHPINHVESPHLVVLTNKYVYI